MASEPLMGSDSPESSVMTSRLNHILLSPASYDDDTSSVRSLSAQDSDSEDDEFLRLSRSTLELSQHDRTVLDEEEEREKLLTRGGPADGLRRIFSSSRSSIRIGKRERRKRRRQERRDARRRGRRKAREDDSLMCDAEEGYRDDLSTQCSTPSSEVDRQSLSAIRMIASRRVSGVRLIPILLGFFVLFSIFLLGAYKASADYRAIHHKALVSNGTALFTPTTILISLDGFRADFLNRGLTPTLNSLIAEGISPRYMVPSFPSVTFPNHFTLVTGLYPESHGIVGNSFWDPEFQEEFVIESSITVQSKWWNAEPLWVTAEKQGVRSAIHMWPGSDAHISGVDPSFFDEFNEFEVLPRKTDRILQFLDLPGEESYLEARRPQFIAAYVPNVDIAGHKYGPNSTEIRSTIAEVDGMLAGLLRGIQARNLTDIVNIIVVSDHGMATTSTDRLVQLEDLVDMDLVDHLEGWPLRGLRPKRSEDLHSLWIQLSEKAKNFPNGIEVYTHETMPERYHFSNNERIAPIWIIPKAGWAVVDRAEFDIKKAAETGEIYHPIGLHGYDHEHPLMRAIFVARGPAFPHQPNSRIDIFQNIEVYNMVCDSIGLKPLPNNGTMRLPLQPSGLHSDVSVAGVDSPEDPQATSKTSLGMPTSAAPASGALNGSEQQASSGHDNWRSRLLRVLEKLEKWLNEALN